MKQLWVDMKLVHGNSRHPESQGSVECMNGDFKDIIVAWMADDYIILTLTVLVTTIDAQWEGMGDVASVRYEPALLPPCPTIRVLSYSN